MKVDVIALLHNEYPFLLDERNDVLIDFLKQLPNGKIHIKNMDEINSSKEYSLEYKLLKEISTCIQEMGYDESYEYFSAITKSLTANVNEYSNNRSVIIVDDLLKGVLFGYFLTIFVWAENIDDVNNYNYCMKQLIFLLDMGCIKRTPGSINYEKDTEWLKQVNHMHELASNCYWVSWSFMVIHEIAHIVLGHTEKEYIDEQEYEADKFAYDIILRLIEKNINQDNESFFYEYTYLSPMMLFDFYRIINFFQKLIYPDRKVLFKPEPQTRINKLLEMNLSVNIDTSQGNLLYNCYLDVLDVFCEQLKIKFDLGKLDMLSDIKNE